MIFFPTQWWNTSNSHKMKENTPCQVLMTKNGKTVLMHSPATGPWLFVGTRACYWGPSASLSESNRKIPPRSPLPGFVSAFTLAHAIGSWCQISGASGARTNTKSHLDLGKHLEGNSCTEHPRLGRQGGLWHSPTTHAIAPNGQHSSESHLQVQPGSAPSSTIPFLGRRIWVSEEVRSPSCHWGLLSQAGGTTNPATPHRAAPCASPPGCCTRASTEPWLDSSLPSHRGREGTLWESPWEQVAHGADIGRKLSVALK